MASIEELANTLRGVATSGMKPKMLIAAVREQHPKATKKEVVRAAFYTLTDGQRRDHDDLHSFALTELAVEERQPVKPRKKKKGRKAKLEGQAAH